MGEDDLDEGFMAGGSSGRGGETYIGKYEYLWGSDGRPTSTGGKSGSGYMWTSQVPWKGAFFPQPEIVSTDPDRRRLDMYESLTT